MMIVVCISISIDAGRTTRLAGRVDVRPSLRRLSLVILFFTPVIELDVSRYDNVCGKVS